MPALKRKPAPAAAPKDAVKKALKTAAEENLTKTITRAKEEPRVLKQGKPLDHSVKTEPVKEDKPQTSLATYAPEERVGMSKGATLNMGDYESLRIDAWLSTAVLPEETVQEAFSRIADILDEVIQEAIPSDEEPPSPPPSTPNKRTRGK